VQGSRPSARRTTELATVGALIVALLGIAALQADGRLIKRTVTVTVPGDVGPDLALASAKAKCPKGKRVVLGGFDVPVDYEDTTMTHLKTAGKRGWRAGVVNYGSPDPTTLTSIAYCAKLKGIKVRKKTVTLPAAEPDEPPGTVLAKCHRGERLAFGGFDYAITEDNNAYLSELRKTGKRGWTVGALNFDGTAELTAIAYCSKHATKTTTTSESVIVEGTGEELLAAKCDQGERLAFGGYSADVETSNPFVLLHGLARTSGRAWQVSARNDNPVSPGNLTAFAYCAKKR
jgi:hypothetical protein